MIFVTLGTNDKSFVRLLKAVEDCVRSGVIQEKVVVQAGYTQYESDCMEIFDYIEGDATVFERGPLEKLADEGQLMSYMHRGYWQCMDNKREMDILEAHLRNGTAPWKKWEN